MKNLIIIGARGWGREVYLQYTICKEAGLIDCSCKGFLDSKTDALDEYEGYPPIIGNVEDYIIQPDDVFFCAMGDVKWRKHYASIIEEKGGEFINLVHPEAVLGKNIRLGKGCYIGRNVEMSCDITIGDFVSLFSCCALGHDSVIGDYSHLGFASFLGGYAQIGKGVTVHPNAKILPHVKVADEAVVGAGSVVIKNVKSGTTVFGIPAKKLEVL